MGELAIGIDLGTTNSCVAIVENGTPRVLPGAGGANTTPSIVCADERGHLIVGHQAKRRFLTHPQDTIYGAKRLMGRRFDSDEMADIQKHFFYDIVEGDDAEPRIVAGGQQFRLEDVSAMILTQLRDAAQEHIGRRVSNAVISVPAYFTQRQREAVRKAGEMAELTVLRIINEPTAAALSYGFGHRNQQSILVYDLGGGTFDVTVLKLYEEVYEVVATGGNSFLGGIDFDNRIVEYFVEQIRTEHGVDVSDNKVALQRLRDAAERAKIDLSSVAASDVNLPFLAMQGGQSLDFSTRITRERYDELTKPLIIESLKIVERVLREANLAKDSVDEVLFVGGMTRAPLVSDMVTRYFGRRPRKDVHPDEVVALGAAILADAISQGQAAVTLVDVLPVSIGIGVSKGQFRKLINKNTSIPVTHSQTFRTTKDNQTGVAIRVYQGESRDVANNEYLGEMRLSGFPPKPKGQVQVEIQFQVDQDSILKVSARDSAGGREIQASFITEAIVSRERYRADRILNAPEREAETSAPANPAEAPAPTRRKPGFLKRMFRRRADADGA